jgi:CDP-glucose 4,6-dehydratase
LYTHGTAFTEAWNFGPYDASVKPVGWLVEQMLAHWGEDATWAVTQGSNFHEHTALSLDSAKARSKLAWQPKLALDDALKQIVDWTKSYQSGADMRQVTQAAIQQFIALP